MSTQISGSSVTTTSVTASGAVSAGSVSATSISADTINSVTLTKDGVAVNRIVHIEPVSLNGLSGYTFTGIPSWAKRVIVTFKNASTSGTADIRVQIGAGSTPESSTYNGGTSYSASRVNWTTGAAVVANVVAANQNDGIAIISLVDSTNFVYSILCEGEPSGTSQLCHGTGNADISGLLGCVRVVTTDTFDNAAAYASIMYEG